MTLLDRFNALNELNKAKVTVLLFDIDDKLQMDRREEIEISINSVNYSKFPELNRLVYNSTLFRRQAREDALKFLKQEDIVWKFRLDQFDAAHIGINLNIFERSKAEILNENVKINGASDPNLFEIEYTRAGEVVFKDLISNKQVCISKPNFDSESDNVINYITKNPNKKITKKEIEQHYSKTFGKSLPKIIDNLKFTGELRKAFINVSKNTIIFRNPLKKSDIPNVNVEALRQLFTVTP